MKKAFIALCILTIFSCTRNQADEDVYYCDGNRNLSVSAVLDGEEKVVGDVLELSAAAGAIYLGNTSTIISRWQGASGEWTFQLQLPDTLIEEGESYTFDDNLSFYFIKGIFYKGIEGTFHIDELEYVTTSFGYKDIKKIKATLNGRYKKQTSSGYEGDYDLSMTFCGIVNE